MPLVIQDRSFDRDNQLVYMTGHPMERMLGFLGDRIMVNGLPDFTLPVSANAYRLRLLNGSNSRVYRIAWQDGRPLTIIGTDGGLLERPVRQSYAFLSPGERLEIWSDFSKDPVGFETTLVSLSFEGVASGRGMMMGRRLMQGQALPNGAGFNICRIEVIRRGQGAAMLPVRLTEIGPARYETAVNMGRPKQFFLTQNHMQWAINGRVFEMEDVAPEEIVQRGTQEIWEFDNTSGGMMSMMNLPHPIHLHGRQFRVLERRGVRHRGIRTMDGRIRHCCCPGNVSGSWWISIISPACICTIATIWSTRTWG